MKRARLQTGSVVFDKRRKTWNFLWCENGHRRTKRIGLAREFPTKTLAWRAAEPFRRVVENPVSSTVITVRSIVAQYRAEKMQQRIGQGQHSRDAPQLSLVDGCGGDFPGRSTKADAAFRHSHDHEHLWGCGGRMR